MVFEFVDSSVVEHINHWMFHLFSSPTDFVSPDRTRELSGKISNLELQLEMESQQKEEALIKVETLDGRVAELEQHLQIEAQQKQEDREKIQATEQRADELELQLHAEAQQKLEAMEKVEMLEFRVADLDRQLEEQSHAQSETNEQVCCVQYICSLRISPLTWRTMTITHENSNFYILSLIFIWLGCVS